MSILKKAECDVCESADGEPHCNCGNCDCAHDEPTGASFTIKPDKGEGIEE
jgi:hypothetical protein